MKHITRLSGPCFFAALLLVFALLICSCAPVQTQPIPAYENGRENASEEPTEYAAVNEQESEEAEEPPPSPRFGIYSGAGKLRPVLGGLGITIISTSRGVISDREARQRKLGGEVLCEVW